MIERRWGTPIKLPPISTASNFEEYKDEDEQAHVAAYIQDTVSAAGY